MKNIITMDGADGRHLEQARINRGMSFACIGKITFLLVARYKFAQETKGLQPYLWEMFNISQTTTGLLR
jgi:hypothetical protein